MREEPQEERTEEHGDRTEGEREELVPCMVKGTGLEYKLPTDVGMGTED